MELLRMGKVPQSSPRGWRWKLGMQVLELRAWVKFHGSHLLLNDQFLCFLCPGFLIKKKDLTIMIHSYTAFARINEYTSPRMMGGQLSWLDYSHRCGSGYYWESGFLLPEWVWYKSKLSHVCAFCPSSLLPLDDADVAPWSWTFQPPEHLAKRKLFTVNSPVLGIVTTAQNRLR